MKKVVIKPETFNILSDRTNFSSHTAQESGATNFSSHTEQENTDNQHSREETKRESWKEKFKRFCMIVRRNAKSIATSIIGVLGAMSSLVSAYASFKNCTRRAAHA